MSNSIVILTGQCLFSALSRHGHGAGHPLRHNALAPRNVPPFDVRAGSVTGVPCRSMSLPNAVAALRLGQMGPKIGSGSSSESVTKVCWAPGLSLERRREEEVV